LMRGSCRKSSCVCSITGAARGTPTLPITISKAITAPMTTIASIHALMLGGKLDLLLQNSPERCIRLGPL
jgi:hypothetical protein